ncbi:MAG: DNA repair protein RecN, partial [Chloroflexi bacterium]|nr:DNA repair protein RecN [Chloroflexota bacterium]
DVLSTAERALVAAAQHDELFAPLADRAAGLAAEAAELERDAAAAGEDVELDPATRAAAEERLALLYDLRRKYGDSLDAVVAFGEAAATELARLDDQEGARERLRAEEIERRSAVEEVSAISEARAAAGGRLARAVNAELSPLGLPSGSFGIEIERIEVGGNGADRVRLSLAIKVVLAAADETPLLVFDEIDAGVGGRNAVALGEHLRALSRYHQVVCVTHLAQVAAHADAHIRVGKPVSGGRTVTEATDLTAEERTAELAAMLAGEGAGDEARAAAEALLRAAT